MEKILSIVLFGEGLATGLALTVMLGPVTMIILRYGLEVNRIAGVCAAAGTWFSDFVFIGCTYWMTSSIEEWSGRPDVRLSLFMIGGIGLFLMGLSMALKRRQKVKPDAGILQRSYIQAFAGGFLVNSLSPFTLIFWLGAAIFMHMQPGNHYWYYLGVMAALGMGDFAKAWIAPRIGSWLKEQYVYWIQLLAGVVIACTGIYIVILGVIEG